MKEEALRNARAVRTPDGYTFYRQPDGTYTDHPDPDGADLVTNFDDLYASMEGDLIVAIDAEGRRIETTVYRLELWLDFEDGRALRPQYLAYVTPGGDGFPDVRIEFLPETCETFEGEPHTMTPEEIEAAEDCIGDDFNTRSSWALDALEITYIPATE
jgi:hypothetical protein